MSEIFILDHVITDIDAADLLQESLVIIIFTFSLEKRSAHFVIVINVFELAVCLDLIIEEVLTNHAS